MKNISKIIFAISILLYSCASPAPAPAPASVLGPELVFNGSFDDSTWIATPSGFELYPSNAWLSNKCAVEDSFCYDSWDLSSGVANHVSTRNNTMGLMQKINISAQKTYRVEFDVLSLVPLVPDTNVVLKPGEAPSGDTNAFLYLGGYAQGVTIDKTGHYSADVLISPLGFYTLLIIDSFNIIVIDNLSVKEVI